MEFQLLVLKSWAEIKQLRGICIRTNHNLEGSMVEIRNLQGLVLKLWTQIHNRRA
jgi:hypothetical protein